MPGDKSAGPDAPETPLALISAVLWRRLDEVALEHFRLWDASAGYFLSGQVLNVLNNEACEVHYGIHCGPDWTTREAEIYVTVGRTTTRVQIRRDEAGRWWRNEESVAGLDGVIDIDLALTPSTNLLPVRRLSLGIGTSRESDAAWVKFPELTVERLAQRYTRLEARRYRYESGHGAFSAVIDVDDAGLCVRYGDLWERLAPPVERS